MNSALGSSLIGRPLSSQQAPAIPALGAVLQHKETSVEKPPSIQGSMFGSSSLSLLGNRSAQSSHFGKSILNQMDNIGQKKEDET